MNPRKPQERHIVLIAHHAPWLLNFRGSLIQALRRKGAKVTVIAPGEYPDVRVQLLSLGVDYRSYSLERTGLNPLNDLSVVRQLHTLLRELRPTHVLTTAIKPNIYGSFAAHLTGVENIYSIVTGLGYAFTGKSAKQRLISELISFLYKIAFINVKKVMFQNPDDRNLLINRRTVKASQAAVISGSGVDLDFYQPHSLPSSDVTIFLMIARLIREKGINEYIQAASILRQRNVKVRLLLAGPMDENPTALSKAELEELVRDGIVEYLGELRDVRPALADCHIFVLPSYREGTPRSTLEALATGRPVITTDAPGCRETVINGENGILVPVGDAVALANAMESLTLPEAPLTAWGQKSLELAEQKYDVNLVNTQILNLMSIN